MGRFHIAAKHHQTIAEIYEVKLADLDNAVQHYEQAADYFKGDYLFFLNTNYTLKKNNIN